MNTLAPDIPTLKASEIRRMQAVEKTTKHSYFVFNMQKQDNPIYYMYTYTYNPVVNSELTILNKYIVTYIPSMTTV